MGKALQVVFPAVGRADLREFEIGDPAPHEVQVRCAANGICMFEVSVFRGLEPLSRLGGLAGHEGIGVVTRAGRDVSHLREGDWVSCSHWQTLENLPAANLARYAAAPPDPALYFAEPASCAVTALQSYKIVPGDRVLVLGCGYMGLLNVQALAHSPVAELVVADVRPGALQLASGFGASEVIDSGCDAGKARLEALKNEPFDLVVECAGVAETLARAGELTRPGGRLAIFAWHYQPRAVDLGEWHIRGLTVLNSAPSIGRDYSWNPMQRAVKLLERGLFDQGPLVTHRHRLSDVQTAMELASARDGDYIKGVLLFDD